MATTRIGLVIGSLRKDSLNRKLANAITRLAPADFAFEEIAIGDLPLYNQDHDGNPSEPVIRLKQQVSAAQGLVFLTPEYNRSMPGVLKNALDHGSRPYGQNSWAGKPAGLIGISIGAAGTALAQQHLRNVLAYLDVPTMAQPEAFIQARDGTFDEAGDIGPASREFVLKWVETYVAWVRKLAS